VIDEHRYLAHDPELGRDVVLVAGTGATVRHPNVIPILGKAELDGRLVVALDLVGEPLATWLASSRPWEAIVRAVVAAGRGFVAIGRDFTPEDVFVDAAGRVAVAPIGNGEPRDLGEVLREALGDRVPWRVRIALRTPMPARLDRVERALRPIRLRGALVAAGVIAVVATVAIAWPDRRSRGVDPIAPIVQVVEHERLAALGDMARREGRLDDAIVAYEQVLAGWPDDPRTRASLTQVALDAHRFALALELARAGGDRRAVVLAELGSEQLSDAVRDGSAFVAQAVTPDPDAVRALVAAHALLGRHDLAAGALDRLTGIDRARAATELAIYEGRLDDALSTADPLARARILARRGGHRFADPYRSTAGDWLDHERRARAALDAGDRVLAERELRWCLDHRGEGAAISLALLPEIYLELARLTGTRAAYQAVAELGANAQGDPWTAEARAHL
jgi:tetratricopeptide (TPR) repeat protein